MKRFVADGVHQTSVADIAADVGVTERTFYRHFPSKHAVIFADYDIGFEWFARALGAAPARGTHHRVGAKSRGRVPF